MDLVAKTDVGKKRVNNEDSYFIKTYNDDISLVIVADGLGGYASGEVASKMLVDTVSLYIEDYLNVLVSLDEEKIKEILSLAVVKANKIIFDKEKTDIKYKGMGTTIVAVLKVKNTLFYISVGDSRIYYIDSKLENITQITSDDTYVNELVKTNVITKEEAKVHPQKHMLTKAVGVCETLNVLAYKINVQEGILLLCSDGLTNMLDDLNILEIVKKSKFDKLVSNLIKEANNSGGVDNITVAIIKL